MTLHFILGGVRSGKSLYGEGLVLNAPLQQTKPLYIATAQPLDEGMIQRIHTHQERRKDKWDNLEAPFDMATALQKAKLNQSIMIDCMTVYLTNYLIHRPDDWQKELDALIQTLSKHNAKIVIISNETNFGLHGVDKLSRQFQDEAGLMHQKIAQIADEVILMVAGIPHKIKGD